MTTWSKHSALGTPLGGGRGVATATTTCADLSGDGRQITAQRTTDHRSRTRSVFDQRTADLLALGQGQA
jgi:hypothetical protein